MADGEESYHRNLRKDPLEDPTWLSRGRAISERPRKNQQETKRREEKLAEQRLPAAQFLQDKVSSKQ